MSKIDNEKSNDLAQDGSYPVESNEKHGKIVDLAARAHVEGVTYDEVENKAVLRRIDWHLMPLLIWICKCPAVAACVFVLRVQTDCSMRTSRL